MRARRCRVENAAKMRAVRPFRLMPLSRAQQNVCGSVRVKRLLLRYLIAAFRCGVQVRARSAVRASVRGALENISLRRHQH